MSKLVKTCLGLAAFAAVAVIVPAGASATNLSTLTHPTGTTAPVGTPVIATNVDPTNGSHVNSVLTDANTNPLVTCTTAEMTGTVIENSGHSLRANITSAGFRGTPGQAPPHSTHCQGASGNVTPTPTAATNGLPWCLSSTSAMKTDEFQVRGNECTKAARPIRFVLHTVVGACTYERAGAIAGTYATHPNHAKLTISHVEFPIKEGSFLCPQKGFLDLTMWLYSDTGGKEGPALFIQNGT